MAANLHNIDLSSVYMTAGRDYDATAGYEYLIGAYEVTPTNLALDGSPFPVTLSRRGGFATNGAAKRAAWTWVRNNLPMGAA